ncbi:MAG: glycogen/starch synthase [bacterium]|nr:glycogen/starch synthase [bacterium]
MRILHATAEALPFAKTGGLADVLGALPAAQSALGHGVCVVHPWYPALAAARAPLWIGDVDVPFDGGLERVGVGTLELGTVRYAFVGHRAFRREALYGYPDDTYRFALFARAVPAVAARIGFTPDVVHGHDWHAALLPALLRFAGHLPPGFAGLPSVLTVHNAQYQGWADAADVVAWGRLPGHLASPLALNGRGNLLHAGLVTADHVTTVSPTYARELLDPAVAYGLDPAFAALGPRLTGILNGLDVEAFDPQRDLALAARFGPDDLAGKRRCKEALADEMGLSPARPLLGVVSRLADQKGLDLLLAAVPEVLEQGWNLVLLGSGDPKLEALAQGAFALHPDRIAGHLGYDDALARRIYAGVDALAVPSRFEPCGLAQLIAMRYGTLPVARATGGLVDTIDDGRTGFLFAAAERSALTAALARARASYDDAALWRRMQVAAMSENFDWSRSAQAYDDLYRVLAGRTTPTEPTTGAPP